MTVKIYHNPRCSKSRQTLELVHAAEQNPEIIEYLKAPPTTTEIDDILNRLGIGPRDLIRKNEPFYKELNLDDETKTRAELISAMAAHPILIERPIVVTDKGVRIGRPPESVKDIL